jgi:hypothetical protein
MVFTASSSVFLLRPKNGDFRAFFPQALGRRQPDAAVPPVILPFEPLQGTLLLVRNCLTGISDATFVSFPILSELET